MEEPLIGCVAMMKNEYNVVTRMIASAMQVCDTFTICDTGSTDDSYELVESMLFGRSFDLYRDEWVDFGTNLSRVHERARGSAKWLVWLHADHLIHCYPDFRQWLANEPDEGIDAYMVQIEEEGTSYRLPLLMRGDLPFFYKGKTHEFLALPDRKPEVQDVNGIGLIHLHDGSNREDKHDRDIALLEEDFRARDPRAIFYTAQAHECMGRTEQAAMIYELRATLDGYGEEKWLASYRAAKLREDVDALIECWRQRPWRHEPLTAASRIVSKLPHEDSLFLEQPV